MGTVLKVPPLNNKDSKYGVTNSLYGKNKRDYSFPQSKNIWPGASYAFGCMRALRKKAFL